MIHETICGCIASRPEPDYAAFRCTACPDCTDSQHAAAYHAAYEAWQANWERTATRHVESCERFRT